LKDRIDQALMLRGSYDFVTLDAYRAFVAGVIAEHNRRHADGIEIERAHLRALPPSAPSTWEEASVRVTSSSGFSFHHAFYTVPSRLIGHRLHLRVHDDRIDAYLGAAHLLTLPRGRPSPGSGRTSARPPTPRAGLPRARSPRCSNTRSPNAPTAEPHAILPKRGCLSARRSTRSTSGRYR
jgi:hypothetical protein